MAEELDPELSFKDEKGVEWVRKDEFDKKDKTATTFQNDLTKWKGKARDFESNLNTVQADLDTTKIDLVAANSKADAVNATEEEKSAAKIEAANFKADLDKLKLVEAQLIKDKGELSASNKNYLKERDLRSTMSLHVIDKSLNMAVEAAMKSARWNDEGVLVMEGAESVDDYCRQFAENNDFLAKPPPSEPGPGEKGAPPKVGGPDKPFDFKNASVEDVRAYQKDNGG